MLIDLREQPWWTPADEAELDVLTDALVDVMVAHRARCSVCGDGRSQECTGLDEAIGVVLDWRRRRVLRSRAEYLSIRQSALAELAVCTQGRALKVAA